MKKRIMMLVMIMIFVITGNAQIVHATSTEDIPEGYSPIYSIADLYAIRNNPKGNYILMADIDMTKDTSAEGDWDSGTGWNPIETFSGILDGNGHRIIGMQIFGDFTVTSNQCFGLFEKIQNSAQIVNLGMVDCNIDITINSDTDYRVCVGGLVGEVSVNGYYGKIDGCYVTGIIKVAGIHNRCYTGGLIGYSNVALSASYSIENSYNSCDVNCSELQGDYLRTGGIVGTTGTFGYLDLANCYSIGTIQGNSNTGAIAGTFNGFNYSENGNGSMLNCFYHKGTAEQAIGNSEDDENSVALTTAQMKITQCFTGFDFTQVWEIDPYCSYAYPQLKKNRQIKVDSVTIEKEPEKLTYSQGDSLEYADAILSVTYDDEITTYIPVTKDMLSGYDMSEIGTQTVTVEYSGATTTFEIEVKEIPVTSIEIKDTLSIYRASTYSFVVNILPKNASNKTLTWESEDPSIAVVNANGILTAKGKGTTTITVTTANGLMAECEVTVLVAAVQLSLNKSGILLNEGESDQLTAQILPLESTDTVSWKSDNPTVAEVYDGTVIAKSAGTTTIVAYTESGIQGRCSVTVQKKTVATPENNQATGNAETQNPENEIIRPKVGDKIIVSNGLYKITKSSATKKEVSYIELPKKKTSVTIPATISIDGYDYKVTSIGNKAFYKITKLKKVTIGKNVNSIGKEAFRDCKNLKKIVIKSAVLKKVGTNAIKNINKNASIQVPKKQLSKYKKLFNNKTGYKKTIKIKK